MARERAAMSALTGHVSDYLAIRRALGYKLERAGQLLPQLVGYLEARGAPTITAELAIAWARLPEHATPNHWAQRLAVARGFACYLKTIDPAAEVPPAGVFPARRHRPAPYLWSEEEVCRLLQQAGTLRPRLRAATHQALFGLLVRRDDDLGPPTLPQAVISTLVFYLTLATTGLLLLVALFTRRHRTLHDLVSGLVVVRRHAWHDWALTTGAASWNMHPGHPDT